MNERIKRGIQKRAIEGRLFASALNLVRKSVIYIFRLIIKLIRKLIEKAVNILFKLIGLLFDPVDRLVRYLFRYHYMNNTPVVDNKIVILTFQATYTCNPKYICEEIIKRNADVDLIWDIKNNVIDADYPIKMRFVNHKTFDFYREVASAKIIIENTNIFEQLNMPKKPEQYLIQTWHGSLGIKRLDGKVVMGSHWDEVSKEVIEKCNYLLTNCPWEEDVFREAYWKEKVEFKRFGHARNDIFHYSEERRKEIRDKVCRYFGIDPEKKIFLIAPTHREGISDQKMNLDEIDNVLAALGERFGGEWVVLIRVHNRIKKKAAIWYKDYGALYNATLYPDMQELLCAADCGMTDYSSWIFDYMESYKPAFIVEYDLADFEDARGFYYPIESTPFPIVETLADLPEAILSFEEKSYKEKVKLFLEEKGCIDDGKSSERIADFVLELLQK